MIPFAFVALALGYLFLYSGYTNRNPKKELLALFRGGHAEQEAETGTLVSSGVDQIFPGAFGLPGAPDWGGSRAVVEALTADVPKAELRVTTKRDKRLTLTGGVSDHWTGCLQCYAEDWSGSESAMDRGAKTVAAKLGHPEYNGGVLNAEFHGFRVQLLWKTLIGGDHYGHFHVGARKDGYTP